MEAYSNRFLKRCDLISLADIGLFPLTSIACSFCHEQGRGDDTPTWGDELYVTFNATIASLDSGETIHNSTDIGGRPFDSSESRTSPRVFTLGSDVANKAISDRHCAEPSP